MRNVLEFKWTISRGRDTYGYNICSLWVDDKKVESCNGGGYDMPGECLSSWIKSEFKDQLLGKSRCSSFQDASKELNLLGYELVTVHSSANRTIYVLNSIN